MKHIKTFESWVTNIFKSGDDHWQDYQDDFMGHVDLIKNLNALVGSADQGNWKRFKNLLPKYKKNINDIQIYNDGKTEQTSNVLTATVNGNGDLWEKKKMITALIDNGVDPYFTDHNDNNFYDYIKDQKLKKWVDDTYPDIVRDLEANKLTKGYNL